MSSRSARLLLLPLLFAFALPLWFVQLSPARALAQHPTEARDEVALDHPGANRFVPGEVLVKPRESLQGFVSSVATLVDYPVGLKGIVEPLGVLRLGVPPGREEETVERLRGGAAVEWAEPNYLRDIMAVPNDPLYGQFQWNLRMIRAEQAWDITTGSPDVIVAVLDTGIDSSHPDLQGKLVPGYDFLNDDPDPADDSGHGTHKAGVIAAVTNNGVGVAGIAWGARIMPVKVLNSAGVGPDSVIARGIAYAADHGARIINMSFGSSTMSKLLASAVRYAHEKGVLLVAAAGNTAKLDNADIYPAAYEQVLAVAATDESDRAADFSQHHPYVGVSAPGVHIVSTFWRGAGYGSYVSSSGTSDAAPHVSGLAALIWSVNPRLTNDQVRRIIEQTADDLGPPGKDEYYGAGRINAYKALLAARPAAGPTATVAPTLIAAPTAAPTAAPMATPATVPSSVWYFADGSTVAPAELWLLLFNPNSTPVTARITYLKADGAQSIQQVLLAPVSRKSIFVNEVVPGADLSVKVESDALMFAERAMFFGHDGSDIVGAAAPSTKWYMAEGSTKGDFDTRVVLQNPLSVPASVKLVFLGLEGPLSEISVEVPAGSKRTVFASELLPDAEFSVVVTSDQPVIAERVTRFDQGNGVHGSVAASQLSRVWYLADGRVGDGYDSWILVANPTELVANLKVTYMSDDGSNSVGYYAVRPASRFSIYVNDAIGTGAFGALVESDQPIVVERSTYFGGGAGGQSVVGTPLLAREWYLAEGCTKPPFTESIAVLNPHDRAANLTVTFIKGEVGVETRSFTVKPDSRLGIDVNDLVPDSEVSTRVASDLPIAVERSIYFADGLGGTSSLGVPR